MTPDLNVALRIKAQTEGQDKVDALGESLSTLGVGADKHLQALEHEIGQLKQEMAAAGTASAGATSKIDALGDAVKTAEGKTTTAHRHIADGVRSVSEQLETVQRAALGVFAVDKLATYAQQVGHVADQYNNLSARVKLVVGDQANINEEMNKLVEVAKRTSSGLEGTVTLFSRIAQAGKEMGISQAQALKLTETINQAVQLSGASAEASDAAITQLIQGLQSGVLRGEEFNSVMEQSPRLAQALAAGLGVPLGKLRELAEQGRLTTQEVIRALQSQSAAIATEFGKLPPTIGRAITNLNTEWTKFVGQLDQSSAASATVASGINGLANNLDTIAGVAERAGAVLLAAFAVQGAGAMRAYAAEAIAAGGATNLLGASIAKLPRIVSITVALTGFELGWQIGTWLHENSALARKLGIEIVGFSMTQINALKLIAEAGKDVLTGKGTEGAWNTFKERQTETMRILADMWKDAEQAPQAIGQAATQSEQALAGTQAAAQGVSGAMGSVSAGASTAQDALAALAKTAGVSLPAAGGSVAVFAKSLADAALKSGAVTEVIEKQLPEAIAKLSGASLNEFRTAWLDAMNAAIQAEMNVASSAEQSAERRATAANNVLRLQEAIQKSTQDMADRAAQALGVDLSAASNHLSKAFDEAHENLSILIRSLPQLQAAGIDTGSVLRQSLAKLIDSAKNKADIAAVEKALDGLGKSGDLAAKDIQELRNKLDLKNSDIIPGINSVAEACEKLGLKSQEAMDKAAKEAKEAYDFLVKEGTSSTTLVSKAFEVYAKKAIEANNGVATSALKVEGAMRGVGIETDATTGKVIRLKNAADSVKSPGGGNDDRKPSTGSGSGTGSGRDSDKDGGGNRDVYKTGSKDLGATGGLIKNDWGVSDSSHSTTVGNYSGLGTDAKVLGLREGLEGAALERFIAYYQANIDTATAKAYIDDSGGPHIIGHDPGAGALDSVVNQAREYAITGGVAFSSNMPKSSSSQSSSSGSTSHTITITLPNGATQTVNAASANDASALTSLLQQLGQAQSTSSLRLF